MRYYVSDYGGAPCFYGGSCIHYKAWLEPTGYTAKIFKRVATGWYADIQITTKNISKIFEATVSKLFLNMDTVISMHSSHDSLLKLLISYIEEFILHEQ